MSKLLNKQAWFNYPSFGWREKKAIIIGGGVAGCQMAWHLGELGWKITLIERHEQLAHEASGNPVGVISPKMTSQASAGETFYRRSFEYTLELLQQLEDQGQEVDWQSCGALQLCHNQRELKRWQALSRRSFPTDFLQLLDASASSQQAGIELPYCASYFPQAGWIKPASFCHALSSHKNSQVIYQQQALSLQASEQGWQLLDQHANTIVESEVVIITSGKDLLQFEQSQFLPIMPVAGQTTRAVASAASQKLKCIIGHEGYLTPAVFQDSQQAQQHIFGATFEREQSHAQINSQADLDNYQQLEKYLPEFSHSLAEKNSAHAAIRITTPDRYPYMGALPDLSFYQQHYHDLHQGKHWKKYPDAQYQRGLFVLGGLGSRGLTSSGLLAKILSAVIDDSADTKPQHSHDKSHTHQDEPLLHYCHPARFLVKNLKRGKFVKKE